MHPSTVFRYALRIAAGAALLAACSPSASPGAPTSNNARPTFRQIEENRAGVGGPDMTTGLVYVSDFDSNTVTVFSRSGAVINQIQNVPGPQGLFVDRNHNLWVAASAGSPSRSSGVYKFARGSTSPSNVLNDPTGRPSDVTICPNGTIYVSSIDNKTEQGNIMIYAPGATNPTGTLTTNGEDDFYLTCDTAGNVFSTFVNDVAGSGGVVEYVGGVEFGHSVLPIKLSATPGGIKPDNAGNLLVAEQNADTITEYTEAGAPTGRAIATGSGRITEIAVSANGRDVGAPEFFRNVFGFGVSLTFPGGKVQQKYTANLSNPTGFAFDPGQNGLGI